MLVLTLFATSAVVSDIKSRIDTILTRIRGLVDVNVEWTIAFCFVGIALESVLC